MKIKRVVRTSKKQLIIYPAFFLLFLYGLFGDTSHVVPWFSDAKKRFLMIAFLFILPKIPDVLKNIAKKKHFTMFFWLVLFAVLSMISAYMTKNIIPNSTTVYTTVFILAFFAEIYSSIIYACQRGIIDSVFSMYSIMAWGVLLLSDGVFLATKFVLQMPFFLIGSKFTLVYQHIAVLAFYLLNNMSDSRSHRLQWFLIAFFSGYTAIIAILADCMTGLLGYVFFVGLWMLYDVFHVKFYRIMIMPEVIAGLMILNLVITFSFEAIIQYPAVESFIVEVLGRSATLTGRLNIYRNFLPLTKDYLVWGFGMSNAYTVCVNVFQYADTQNCILEWVIKCGVFATAALLMTIIHTFKCLSSSPRNRKLVPLVFLVYAYLFMGTVEITFDMNFFTWIAMLYGCSQMRKKNGLKKLG